VGGLATRAKGLIAGRKVKTRRTRTSEVMDDEFADVVSSRSAAAQESAERRST
jgi:hypothetical protein